MPRLQLEIEIGKIIFRIIFIGYKYVFINLYLDFPIKGKGKHKERQGSLQKGREVNRKVEKFIEKQGIIQKGR